MFFLHERPSAGFIYEFYVNWFQNATVIILAWLAFRKPAVDIAGGWLQFWCVYLLLVALQSKLEMVEKRAQPREELSGMITRSILR